MLFKIIVTFDITNLQNSGQPCLPQENMQARPDLRRQASRNYWNYEGNVEVNGYDFQRLVKMQAKSMIEINLPFHKHHQVYCL